MALKEPNVVFYPFKRIFVNQDTKKSSRILRFNGDFRHHVPGSFPVDFLKNSAVKDIAQGDFPFQTEAEGLNQSHQFVR